MQGSAKKVTVALDGVIVGTRRNTREYTHAIVHAASKSVLSYHLTAAAAIDNANRRRMRGQSDLVVLPTVIDLHPRYECLNKELMPEKYVNLVVVTNDPYKAADSFFGEIARKKYGPDANVRAIEYFAPGGANSMGRQYRAFIGDVVGMGESEVVVQGEYCEITVQDTRYKQSDVAA
jgi:hypothetical protein